MGHFIFFIYDQPFPPKALWCLALTASFSEGFSQNLSVSILSHLTWISQKKEAARSASIDILECL
jgi:hypothetical protein